MRVLSVLTHFAGSVQRHLLPPATPDAGPCCAVGPAFPGSGVPAAGASTRGAEAQTRGHVSECAHALPPRAEASALLSEPLTHQSATPRRPAAAGSCKQPSFLLRTVSIIPCHDYFDRVI